MTKEIFLKLEEHFKSAVPNKIMDDYGFVRAGVSLILNDKIDILFIKRPENPGDSYSGHIALPGGKKTESDRDLLSTALRETQEEVGIDLELNGKIIGTLDDLKPLNPMGPRYIVTPFVALLLGNVQIRMNEEVEEMMWIPLEHFKDEKNLRIRLKERAGQVIEDYVYEYEKFIIWGMTGRIINNFINQCSVIL